MFRKNGQFRLAFLSVALLVIAISLGALTASAFGAFKGASSVASPRLEPFPKLSDDQVANISNLFDPQLPFNETVVADAFQDRAGLDSAETRAVFNAPVVKTMGASTQAPSGYSATPFMGGAAQMPPVAQQPSPAQDESLRRARLEEMRKSGKLGTKEEASLYSWREVAPLGIVGFQQRDGRETREVALLSLVTRRYFTARRDTRFADGTLAEVNQAGVIFRDAAGTHEVGWSRKSTSSSSSQPALDAAPNIAGVPPTRREPSGYADNSNPPPTNSPAQARRQP